MKIKNIVLSLSIVASTLTANANILRDNSLRQLETAATPQDSIKILYDVLDLSSRQQRPAVAKAIFAVAGHVGDNTVQLDAARQLANAYLGNDSLLMTIEPMISHLPMSDDRRETETFVRLTVIRNKARYASETERINLIRDVTDKLRRGVGGDIYDQIETLATVCALLSAGKPGPIYKEYMGKTIDLINKIPVHSNALRNLYYTQAAIMGNNLGDAEVAVKADKELIKIIRALLDKYRANGRQFKNYDGNLYNSYRRLLSNAELLTPQEIEDYYGKIIEMTNTNPEVKAQFDMTQLPTAYYEMAHGRYAEAIPMLKNAREKLNDPYFQRRILRKLITASTAVNDQSTLIQALTDYTRNLEEYIDLESGYKFRELEVLYGLNDLRQDKEQLQLDKDAAELSFHNKIFFIIIGLFVILTAFSIIVFKLYRRYRRQSRELALANESLTKESAILHETQQKLIATAEKAQIAERHKTDFINNMSHEVTAPLAAITEYSQLIVDCADAANKPYLDRYADIVTLNADLLNTLVNDVLDIGVLENPTMSVKTHPTSIRDICDIALATIKKRVAPGVKLVFVKESAPDMLIVTDDKRVTQVLINLLTNAAKFTEEGSITLDYEVDRAQNRAVFSVTDTGIGIPEGKEKIIFERFEKLDKHTQGSGLGLPICALIARLLKGDIHVEQSSAKGARFIFSIPI